MSRTAALGAQTPPDEDLPGPEVDTSRFITSRGLKFPDDGRFLPPRHRANLRKDRYERKESNAALLTVRPEDRVMELGAGLGYMSSLICHHIKPAAYTAYEANPALLPYIRAVHEANGIEGVELHNALLAPEAGPDKPFYVRHNFLASSMEPMQGDDDGGVAEVVNVPVRDVNEAVESARPTVLMCDIEGAEVDLLPAMKLDGLRVAVIELHPQWIGGAGVARIFAAMAAANLVYAARASSGKVVTFRSDK